MSTATENSTSSVIDNRTWRYATKKFDATKKISEKDLETLLDAIRLSASSYGLQPYEVLVISDQKVKERLRPASWDQSQIEDASQVIVFANKTNYGEELVDEFVTNVSKTRDIPMDGLKGYSDFMKSKLIDLPLEAKSNWTARQAYIALGNTLQAAAELKIDTCPMEGFESDKYNEILGLKDKDLNAAVVLAVGYRSEEDATQHLPKVRKSKEELFTLI
ncbi:NAD(P)H-dependent oxidoreductase [Flagellimonas oceanensis]|uniref:NAD(P)H-dependent oxidoreductase n=1 Tax=Flagellimonas oceanensis TaxID=2499163 RepID=UPI000F8C501C|nr:NAD(P)H-dependent oxidoreductase [Allomuricauda oceanensis]|tara:strand:- start:21610 stop:22266 length:657 start_codon:yes stop_codon:yes gene_type:complete